MLSYDEKEIRKIIAETIKANYEASVSIEDTVAAIIEALYTNEYRIENFDHSTNDE